MDRNGENWWGEFPGLRLILSPLADGERQKVRELFENGFAAAQAEQDACNRLRNLSPAEKASLIEQERGRAERNMHLLAAGAQVGDPKAAVMECADVLMSEGCPVERLLMQKANFLCMAALACGILTREDGRGYNARAELVAIARSMGLEQRAKLPCQETIIVDVLSTVMCKGDEEFSGRMIVQSGGSAVSAFTAEPFSACQILKRGAECWLAGEPLDGDE